MSPAPGQSPLPANNADQEIEVLNKKDKPTGKRVKLSDGIKNPKLESLVDADGKVKNFREKPFLGFGN